MKMVRPQSLDEVAIRVAAGESLDYALADFLDEFYLNGECRERRLAREPAPLENDMASAYLAAVAEHLALQYKLTIPSWVNATNRFLHRPYFSGGLESLKATLLVESPAAFRRRLLFVSANALSRASMHAA
jgi:hypothetical protein